MPAKIKIRRSFGLATSLLAIYSRMTEHRQYMEKFITLSSGGAIAATGGEMFIERGSWRFFLQRCEFHFETKTLVEP